jgi:hypothetical protein
MFISNDDIVAVTMPTLPLSAMARIERQTEPVDSEIVIMVCGDTSRAAARSILANSSQSTWSNSE